MSFISQIKYLKPFKPKSTSVLLRYRLFLSVCSQDQIVANLFSIYTSLSKRLSPQVTNELVRIFTNDVLIGGTNLNDVARVVKRNRLDYHGTIVNFAEEGLLVDDGKPDLIVEEVLNSIDITAKYDKDPIVAIKLSAMIQVDFVHRQNILFEKVHAVEKQMAGRGLTVREKYLLDNTTERQIDTIRQYSSGLVFSSNIIEAILTGDLKLISEFSEFSKENIEYFKLVDKRLRIIFEKGLAEKCLLIIDSEQSFYQMFIDYLSAHYTRKFNTSFGVVMKTQQAYLQSSVDTFNDWTALCHKNGLVFSLKLVRGAYLPEEIKYYSKMNQPSPCWGSLEATHLAYDTVIKQAFKVLNEKDKVVW